MILFNRRGKLKMLARLTKEMQRGLYELGGVVAKYRKANAHEIYGTEMACNIVPHVSFDGKTYSIIEDCSFEPTTFFSGSLHEAIDFMWEIISNGVILHPDDF